MKTLSIIVATYLGVGVPSMAAADPSRPTSLAGVVTISCPAFVEPLLTSTWFELSVRDRPIDVPQICRCAVDLTMADKVFATLKLMKYEEVNRRMQADSQLQAYFISRALQNTMSCFNDELKSRLDESRKLHFGG